MDELTVDVEGPRGATPLVLIGEEIASPGWPGRGALAEQYVVHAIPVAVGQEPGAAVATVLEALSDAPRRAHVVGQGTGVSAALALATGHAEYVARVALLDVVETPDAADLTALAAPTLILDARGATSPAWIADVALGRFQQLSGPAGRLAAERAGAVTAALLEHFEAAATLEQGYASRRIALGDEHVDRTIESMSEYTEDFQDFLTRYCWGEIWPRPGLSRRDRSPAWSCSAPSTRSPCMCALVCGTG